MNNSLSDRDRDKLQRAAELASLMGADAVRAWAGTQSYDVASTLTAYVELAGAAQALLGDLSDIVRRLGIPIQDGGEDLEDEDLEDETHHCATCGATISIFIGHGDGWHHYRGEGTAASPVEIYDAGHQATPPWEG